MSGITRLRYIVTTVLLLLIMAAGCKTDEHRWLDPSNVVDSTRPYPMRPISPGLSAADYTPELVPNAEYPRDGDWSYTAEDYRIRPGDVINIEVMDLFEAGIAAPLQRVVSTTGYIDMPLLSDVRLRASGITREQLRDSIAQAYTRANVLKNPIVTVVVVAERGRQFSILGSVARPSTYPITHPDTRLLEAMAIAGGVIERNIKTIYVIRPTDIEPHEAPLPPAAAGQGEMPPLPELPPEKPATPSVLPAETSATDSSGPTAAADSAEEELKSLTKNTKLIYTQEGKWVRVPIDNEAASQPAEKEVASLPIGPLSTQPSRPPEDANDPWGWKAAGRSNMARIIAIDLKRLQDGDPKMNIVVRDNDVIQVPILERGEFYVTGEVARPGVYDLTGRQVTIKQAIVAASGLGPLAWPSNAILIRRIGNNQEQTFPLNVEAIFHGEENDIYLKPNDVLAVGQSIWSPFVIVLRNAFRMTYGFGFIYDRNFSDPLLLTPDSKRFTRW